jgi:transposase
VATLEVGLKRVKFGKFSPWRIRTEAPWRDLPEKYGKSMTVYQRFRRWSEAGIWEAVTTTLAQAMADNSRHGLDSTTARGHVSAAGATRGSRTSFWLLEGRVHLQG